MTVMLSFPPASFAAAIKARTAAPGSPACSRTRRLISSDVTMSLRPSEHSRIAESSARSVKTISMKFAASGSRHSLPTSRYTSLRRACCIACVSVSSRASSRSPTGE
jgi:hypothetical protein